MMSVDDNKSKHVAAKKPPAAEGKTAGAAPTSEVKRAEANTESGKTDAVKAEGANTEAAKSDAAPSSKGMGEGQKPVSQAYKDNWNAIFAKKKKR
jgi:hypothetical protein